MPPGGRKLAHDRQKVRPGASDPHVGSLERRARGAQLLGVRWRADIDSSTTKNFELRQESLGGQDREQIRVWQLQQTDAVAE